MHIPNDYTDFRKSLSTGQRFQYGAYQFADHFFGRKKLFKDRKSFYEGLLETFQKQGEGRLMPVERRKDISIKEFKEKYVYKGVPVVLEGAAKDWPCVQKWSLQYFKDLHGDDEIVMVDHNKTNFPYELTTLADVIDNIRSGGGKYYRFYPLLSRHPEHIKDFDLKWLQDRRVKPAFGDSFQVFIGGAGSYTSLHNANQPNLFVQAHGEKKWEIDVFKGRLDGLIIAEIELESEDEAFSLPDWADKEVSDDVRYYNSNLVKVAEIPG